MRRKLGCCLGILAFAAALDASPAEAQYTVTCLTPKIVFGNGAQFQLQGSVPGNVQSTTWEAKWDVGACSPGYQPVANTGNPTQMNISYVGTLTVRCTVVVNNGRNVLTTYQPTCAISVPPPDGVRVITDDSITKPLGQDIGVAFQITCGGVDSYYMNVQVVQEKNDDIKRPGMGGNRPGPGQWVPTPEEAKQLGDKSRFQYYPPGRFYDIMRSYGNPTSSANAPLISTMKQNYRVILLDPCGNPMAPLKLGSLTVKYQLNGPGQWQVIHQPVQ